MELSAGTNLLVADGLKFLCTPSWQAPAKRGVQSMGSRQGPWWGPCSEVSSQRIAFPGSCCHHCRADRVLRVPP
jgi:hypothetical protein